MTNVNEILDESKIKKNHLTQHSKIITSIKKDLSQQHVAKSVIKDPIKKISLANGIPISKSKISFMGNISITR